MNAPIEEVFGKLLTRIVREPAKADLYTEFPRLFVAPDWPVYSHLKMKAEETAINGGKHWHGIFLVPPRSRLWKPLSTHVEEKQGSFAGRGRPVMRLHAVPIVRTERKAIGYALKQVDRQRVSHSDILILPKTQGEMPGVQTAGHF